MLGMFVYDVDDDDWHFAGFDDHQSCMEDKRDFIVRTMNIAVDCIFIFELPNMQAAKDRKTMEKAESTDWDAALQAMINKDH